MTGGTVTPEGGGLRDALAAALGSAVLDVLTERGLTPEANAGASPRGGARPPGSELERRGSRWMTTSPGYLGAAAADPVSALARIVGASSSTPGRGGQSPSPGSGLAEGARYDPAPFEGRDRSAPRPSNYGSGNASPEEQVRFGYGD